MSAVARSLLSRRALISALVGIAFCLLFWLRPDGPLDRLNGLPYLVAILVSRNAHAPSGTAAFIAMWLQWTVVAYGVSLFLFPRIVRD